MIGTPAAITAAAVLHPAAQTLPELDLLLRTGRLGYGPAPVGPPSAPVLPCATLTDFSPGLWAERHLAHRPRDAARLLAAADRATLPTATAACVAVAATEHLNAADPERFAVILAGGPSARHQAQTALTYHRDPRRIRARHLMDSSDTDALGAVSQVVNARGEGFNIGGASASGTLALIHGARLIGAGHADRCLVVAPACDLAPADLAAFLRSGAMAAREDDTCRPFDRTRCGFVPAQAAAAVLLEPAADDTGVHVLGCGLRLDGRRGTEPATLGQQAAIRAALADARLAPADIDYVNAHATGSRRGDEEEATTLHTVFGDRPWTNATKGLLGHALTAAGLLETVAVLLQLRGGYCHPNHGLTDPIRPGLRLTGPRGHLGPLRRALSTSYAFGGVNAAVVLGAPRTPQAKEFPA